MSISVSSTNVVDQISATLLEAAKAVEGDVKADEAMTAANAAASAEPVQADARTTLVQGGFVERILGETHTAAAVAPAQVHAEHVDKSAETANMQAFARPQAAIPEPTRELDNMMVPTDKNGHNEFALPASLLVPATLVGLQVEPGAAWAMQARGFGPDLGPLHEARVHDRHAPRAPIDEESPEPEDEEAAEPAAEQHADHTDSVEFADEDASAWCDALTRALRDALAAKAPPPALLLAAQQWQRGRCVVLACPQNSDPAAAAWAFVLWPRKQLARRADDVRTPQLALYGARVEARLQWSTRPTAPRWHYVRVIKQHHPRTGRQLVPSTAEPCGRVPCEVQLGPVLARPLRNCDVCLRINAVRRFWIALGTQWSMHVVVCSHALLSNEAVEENIR